MTSAFIDAAEVRFPPRCIRCDGAADTTHDLDVRRGIDLVLFASWEFLSVPVPICARCRRRRRIAGIVMTAGMLLAILGGGFAALLLVMNDWTAAAAIVALLVIVVAIGGRFRGDQLLEWMTLGVRADFLKGDGTPLRLSFRRPEYSAAWFAATPHATLVRTLIQRPVMTDNAASAGTPTFGRTVPAVTLLVCLGLLALHHWYATTQHATYSVLVLLLAAIAGLSIVGTIHPPIFYALGGRGKHLPASTKVLAALSMAAGAGTGFYLMIVLY